MRFRVRLSSPTDVPVTVVVSTSLSTGEQAATRAADDQHLAGITAIRAGHTFSPWSVQTEQDNLQEGDDTFIVEVDRIHRDLEGGTGDHVLLTASAATVTIVDDDDLPNRIRLSVNPTSVSEGAGRTMLDVTATLVGNSRLTEDLIVGLDTWWTQ